MEPLIDPFVVHHDGAGDAMINAASLSATDLLDQFVAGRYMWLESIVLMDIAQDATGTSSCRQTLMKKSGERLWQLTPVIGVQGRH